MARASRPQRVHSTNPRTIGGGMEWRDMFPLPNWAWVIILTVGTIFRNFFSLLIGGTLLVWFVQWWFAEGLLSASIKTGLSLLSFLFVITVLLMSVVYTRYSYAPTFKRLFVALMRWWTLRKRWTQACSHAGFRKIPKLKKIKFSPNGIIAKAKCGKFGITPNDFRAGSDEIVGTLEAHEMRVDSDSPAFATLHLIWGDPTSRILLPGDLEGMTPQDELAVVFALDPDHMPTEVPIGVSIGIFGESESGKSNALWSILNGLNARGINYRMRIIDPAGGVELQELEEGRYTLEYTDKISDSEALIARAKTDMNARLARMKHYGITKWTPDMSEEEPLDILIVDELLLLKKFDEHTPFGERLTSGRKAGHIVLGLSQLSQKDALGAIRDLFPTRMCHATKSIELTDTALGPDSEKNGAKCASISKGTPGVGYIYNRNTRSFVRFRTPLVSKSDRLSIAAGEIIRSQSGALAHSALERLKMPKLQLRRTFVYKFFTDDDTHGYTGMTWNFEKRRNQHVAKSWWFDQINEDLTEVEEYPTRKAAKAAETWSIEHEKPIFNKKENERNPDRVDEFSG